MPQDCRTAEFSFPVPDDWKDRRVIAWSAQPRPGQAVVPNILATYDRLPVDKSVEGFVDSQEADLARSAKKFTLIGRREVPVERPQRVSLPVRAARADLFANTINEGVIARPGIWLSRALVYLDNRGVDGAVNGIAALLGGTSGRLRRTQTGFVRSYALTILGGSVVLVAALLVVGGGAG